MRFLPLLAALLAATLMTMPAAAKPDNGGAHGPRIEQHEPSGKKSASSQSDRSSRDRGSGAQQTTVSKTKQKDDGSTATGDTATNDNVTDPGPAGEMPTAGPGNSWAAHACQQDQEGYSNVGQCVASHAHELHQESSQGTGDELDNNDNTSVSEAEGETGLVEGRGNADNAQACKEDLNGYPNHGLCVAAAVHLAHGAADEAGDTNENAEPDENLNDNAELSAAH